MSSCSRPDVRVRPVQVRLLGREEVEVPLARLARSVEGPRPRRAAEDRLPAVRGQLAVLARAGSEPEARSLRRAGRRGKRLAEPRVLVRDVVRDDVHDRPDPELSRLRDQRLGLLERAERRIDRAVVSDVVARVGHRRRVPGVEPERIDAQVAQVRAAAPGRRRGRRSRRRSRPQSSGRRPGTRPRRATRPTASGYFGERDRVRPGLPAGLRGRSGLRHRTTIAHPTIKCKSSTNQCIF